MWPDALELLLVAARPTFAEPYVAACAVRPGALALRIFAGRVAERLPFAEPGVVAQPALLRRDVLPVPRELLEPDVLPVQRVLLEPDARRALLLLVLVASVLAR